MCYAFFTMLTTAKKQKIVKEFGRKEGDTGSPEVQVALLSAQIDDLTKHLQTNKKDLHSRRGLVVMVAERRKLLNYLKKTDQKAHDKLVKQVGLK